MLWQKCNRDHILSKRDVCRSFWWWGRLRNRGKDLALGGQSCVVLAPPLLFLRSSPFCCLFFLPYWVYRLNSSGLTQTLNLSSQCDIKVGNLPAWEEGASYLLWVQKSFPSKAWARMAWDSHACEPREEHVFVHLLSLRYFPSPSPSASSSPPLHFPHSRWYFFCCHDIFECMFFSWNGSREI